MFVSGDDRFSYISFVNIFFNCRLQAVEIWFITLVWQIEEGRK